MQLSKAIQAFLFAKEIQGLSPNTTRNYALTLRRFLEFFGSEDPGLAAITTTEVRAFLHSLQIKAPVADLSIPRPLKPLGPKTIRNCHAALSSLWEWAIEEELVAENVVRKIKPPNPKLPTVKPFEEADIKAIIRAMREAKNEFYRLRDTALVLFLLDTGVRSSELCSLKVSDIDLKQGSAVVRGKGRLDSGRGRERIVFFGDRVRRSLQRFLIHRSDLKPGSWLFVVARNRQFTRDVLGRRMKMLGERAGVKHSNPHRFRHTFAIIYLRNGGDIFTLQRQLGHSSLDMVKRYLAIAMVDIEKAHRKAGPVDNWGL